MTITADLDRIRLLIGDTDMTDPLLSDEEINVQVANWPENRDLAAANCAEAICAKFSRQFDFTTDGQMFTRSQRVNYYRTLASDLRKRAGLYSIPNPAGTSGTA